MNASDWPSGDSAIAERNGRALGCSSVRAISLAGDTPTRTRATTRGGSCRARRHVPSAERAATATTTIAATVVRRRTYERCWCCHITRRGARIFDSDAQAPRVRPAAPLLLVEAMPQQGSDSYLVVYDRASKPLTVVAVLHGGRDVASFLKDMG